MKNQNAIQLVSVSRNDVARIISEWWRRYEADQSAFSDGPPTDEGKSSGDYFFEVAMDLGLAVPECR